MFLTTIRAMVVMVGVVAPALAEAQGLRTTAVTTAPAPRILFSEDEMALARAVSSRPALAAFYGGNGLKPIFAGPEASARRQALISATAGAGHHGLPVSRYEPRRLDRLNRTGSSSVEDELAFARVFERWVHDIGGGVLEPRRVDANSKREVLRPDVVTLLHAFERAADPAAVLAGIEPKFPQYLALQRALGNDTDLIAPASLPKVANGVWREGSEGQAVLDMRKRLVSLGFDEAQPVDLAYFDADLGHAVRAYQSRLGIGADGIAGPHTVEMLNRDSVTPNTKIAVSLERMRWLAGHDLNARHVWVNLPEFNARIIENGQEMFETRVVIGKDTDDRRTPEFSDEIEYMVVNPRWNIPRSITVKEYLPRLQANRNAVSHLDIVDGNGNVIPRDRIDFSKYTTRNFPYRMRQKPSDDNALGLVKFMFPNPWNIYLHDTPTKHLFDQSSRAYSHGCIRIGRPFDLAYQLLRDTSDDPKATFQRALDGGRETWLHLKQNIPVHLVYFTALPDSSGKIRYFRDVYERDANVAAALQRAALEVYDEVE